MNTWKEVKREMVTITADKLGYALRYLLHRTSMQFNRD